MGLFSEIDEIAERQKMKSELGGSRIFGMMLGIVTNNYSKDYPGRICVSIPQRDKDANVLKWARLAMPYVGKKWGVYFVPEVGDQVLLAFEDGNIEKPFVIGCVPTSNSTFVSGHSDENNQIKCIQTKNGNVISLTDAKEGEGEKDSLKIATAKGTFYLKMDNENHKVELSDSEKKNAVAIQSDNGSITINAEKKLKIKAGDIEINMNGESAKISVKCKKLKLEASDNIKIETSGMYKLQSENAITEANSAWKASGKSTVTIEGAVIKLG